MLSTNLGREGFYFWMGIIEDINDPLQLGRVRPRIFNIHDDSLSTTDLPWTTPSMPPDSAQLKGVGDSPTGPQVGTLAWGFFLDGKSSQMPVLAGVIPVILQGNTALHSVSGLARGKNTIKKELIGPEPHSAYAAKYPYNQVKTTIGGHAVEFDNTPGAERIHIYHKSGSYIEMRPDGGVVLRSSNNTFDIVAGNKTIYSNGEVIITSQKLLANTPNLVTEGNLYVNTGATGTFTSVEGKVIDVVKGIVVNIF